MDYLDLMDINDIGDYVDLMDIFGLPEDELEELCAEEDINMEDLVDEF